jgi:hypothetical protein
LVKSAFCVDVTSSGMRSVAAIKFSIYTGTSHVHVYLELRLSASPGDRVRCARIIA